MAPPHHGLAALAARGASTAPTTSLGPAALPAFSPDPEMLPLTTLPGGTALSDEDAAKIEALSAKLTALDATYPEGLRAIYAEYNAVLATVSPHMSQEEYNRLWRSYEKAQRAQEQLYQAMLEAFEALHAEYAALTQTHH
jgi:hypothetical protein